MTGSSSLRDGASDAVRDCLAKAKAPPALVRAFMRQYAVLVRGESGLVHENQIAGPGPLPAYDELGDHDASGLEALGRTVVIKLNGGLGTGMGLAAAKSLLPVKEGKTFLDILAGQVAHLRRATGQPIPLLLMNSEYTAEDTARALGRYPDLPEGQQGLPLGFLQHRVPKLTAADFSPARCDARPELAWCPPGHGDIYTALVTSRLLDQLLDRGIHYAFVSNADNLGATLDPALLGYFATEKLPFMMEVTRRTEADRKGGHLARNAEGRLLLRERAQCPEAELAAFQDIERYQYFNTNNLWLALPALKALLDREEGVVPLPLIVNHKTLDPRDADSTPVLQLETAMGAAISLFPDAVAVSVPRSRFAPVKTTDDLLVLWSDACALTPEMHVALRPERAASPPVVHLDPAFYRLFDAFSARFPDGAPSLRRCDSLRVEGDIRFGAEVVLTGDVVLCNAERRQAVLPAGSRLDSAQSPFHLAGDRRPT